MTYLKLFSLACIIALTGCGGSNSTSNDNDKGNPSSTTASVDENGKPVENGNEGSGYWERLEMKEIKDDKGMIAAIMPFPSSWKLGMNPAISGPNGITVNHFPTQSYMINFDPSLQYAYSNQQQRQMPGIDQLVQQDFVPWGQNKGMEMVNYYEIPEISKMDKWYSDQLFKALPSRSDITAIGIDFKKNDGTPYFLLVHLNVSTSNTMQYWYYIAAGLEANADYFEKAKKQYIFALANTRYNLEPIMAYNKAEAQRVNQSWAAHNQRMAQNQANFEASQRAFVNKSEAINDAIMSGWRARNASSDINQEKFIDGIYERTNVQNTETGQMYKVSAGANQYWMNRDGEYISTKLHDYNPNLDDNMNNVKWQQLKEVRKN